MIEVIGLGECDAVNVVVFIILLQEGREVKTKEALLRRQFGSIETECFFFSWCRIIMDYGWICRAVNSIIKIPNTLNRLTSIESGKVCLS